MVCLSLTGLSSSLVAAAAETPSERIDFNRDVRPILSENCFKCHGPDEAAREAKLRLDLRETATQPAKSGEVAIAPGDAKRSELVLRTSTTDEIDIMPPVDSGKKLTPVQIETLKRWVEQGADYAPHWSFVPPAKPTPPKPAQAAWAKNAVDRFVLARLEQEKVLPAPEADKATLLRRVSLDLTGLPPTIEQLDAFLTDKAPGAYERVVDRLLASTAYGERMATDWLDAARYADSNGFFRDNTRQIWPWRDWVIHAFNRNLPFDQFTIEQLAGDLLPNATADQKIATGFNRNHMVTGETGVIDEEYRVEYVADRLETTSTVWLGLTVGCARCHDHKFDPISQREYYQMFAFFNSGVEKGTITPDDPPPVMDVASPAQREELEKLRARRTAAESAFRKFADPLAQQIAAWEKEAMSELRAPTEALLAHIDFEPEAPAAPAGDAPGRLPRPAEKGGIYYESTGLIGQSARFDGMQHFELPPALPIEADEAWTIGLWVQPTASLAGVLSKIEPTGDRRGFEIIWAKGQLQINLVDRWVVSAIEVVNQSPIKRVDWSHVIVSYDGSGKAAGLRVFADGLELPLTVVRDSLRGPITNQEPLRIGRRDSSLGFYGQLDEARVLGRAITPQIAREWFWSERLRGIFATDPSKRDARQKTFVLDCFVERHGDADTRLARRRAEEARDTEDRFRATLPKTLVMQELEKPKPNHVLKRGQYDAPGELVEAGVPAALPAFPADLPRNRLGLAQWLVSPNHPLTARVMVNRLWFQCFGEGLVSTLNDFGAQGDAPSHPELLDWLAREFVESGWDVKGLLRLIVTSATYRQDSAASPELLQRDPENRMFARGPRFRLSGEMIRDQALVASGLLVNRVGGPPVKPYQPPGLWEAVSYNGELSYQPDRGEGLWRRTVYSYWKRTAPPPGVQVFDGPTRETCVVRRPRTNTPLQALLLLNDDTFVEAARALAAQVMSTQGAKDKERVREMFRRATSRHPDPQEATLLRGLYERQRARFAADRAGAEKLIAVGVSERGRELESVELAAWTVVAQAILNLDEVITRR
jgi:hypothetical protein